MTVRSEHGTRCKPREMRCCRRGQWYFRSVVARESWTCDSRGGASGWAAQNCGIRPPQTDRLPNVGYARRAEINVATIERIVPEGIDCPNLIAGVASLDRAGDGPATPVDAVNFARVASMARDSRCRIAEVRICTRTAVVRRARSVHCGWPKVCPTATTGGVVDKTATKQTRDAAIRPPNGQLARA